MDKVHFSQATDSWYTPIALLEELKKEYGPFDSDPALQTKKIDWQTDGLNVEWGARTFCNPPYSDLERWCSKACREFEKGKFIILLIPSRTDTYAWHNYCMKAQEIQFFRGRIMFDGAKAGAPFPSCLVIFDPKRKEQKMEVKTRDFKNRKQSESDTDYLLWR